MALRGRFGSNRPHKGCKGYMNKMVNFKMNQRYITESENDCSPLIIKKKKQKRPRSGDPYCKTLWKKVLESIRGNMREATKPRASERQTCLSEGLWEGAFSEVFSGFKRFSEVFIVFGGFWVYWDVLSETLSETDVPLGGSQSCCPYNSIVLPHGLSLIMLGPLQIDSQWMPLGELQILQLLYVCMYACMYVRIHLNPLCGFLWICSLYCPPSTHLWSLPFIGLDGKGWGCLEFHHYDTHGTIKKKRCF